MPKALFVMATLGAAAIWIALGVWLPWRLIAAAVAAFAIWLAVAPAGRRTASITAAGIATLPRRFGGASVALVGTAGVVGVLVALLAMGNGFRAILQATGSDDTAIVLSSDSPSEIGSTLDPAAVTLIGSEPQVLRDAAGRPVASPELLTIVSLPNKGDGLADDVSLRGVGPEVWALRPNVKVIVGRRFRTGLRELIVGKDAAREFAHTSIGAMLDLDGEPWKVVGEFDSGDEHNSELWADTDVVATTFRRGSSTNAVTVRLRSAQQYPVAVDSSDAVRGITGGPLPGTRGCDIRGAPSNPWPDRASDSKLTLYPQVQRVDAVSVCRAGGTVLGNEPLVSAHLLDCAADQCANPAEKFIQLLPRQAVGERVMAPRQDSLAHHHLQP